MNYRNFLKRVIYISHGVNSLVLSSHFTFASSMKEPQVKLRDIRGDTLSNRSKEKKIASQRKYYSLRVFSYLFLHKLWEKTYRSSCSRAWAGTNRDRSLLADRPVRATFEKKGKKKKKRERDHCLSSHMPVTEWSLTMTQTSMAQSNTRDDKNHFSYDFARDDRPIDTHDRLGCFYGVLFCKRAEEECRRAS